MIWRCRKLTSSNRVRRVPKRAHYDYETVHGILDEGLICHLAFVHDGRPYAIPTLHARVGDTVYIHGSAASRMVRTLEGESVPACLTVTLVDGLVLARSAFHHSMNYRSAVVIGTARVVEDPDERRHALDLIVDQMVPGRSATLRPSTRKELAATAVLAVPLREASMKQRAGGPGDEPADVAAGVWGGHVPVRRVLDAPVPAEDNPPGLAVPAEVVSRARRAAP